MSAAFRDHIKQEVQKTLQLHPHCVVDMCCSARVGGFRAGQLRMLERLQVALDERGIRFSLRRYRPQPE